MRDLAQIVQGVRNLFIRCQASSDKRAKMNISKDNSLLDNLLYNLDLIHGRCRDLIEISADYEGYREISTTLVGDNLAVGSGSTIQTGVIKSMDAKSNGSRVN